jgi:vWA-MoxR associated protein C-terminal domain
VATIWEPWLRDDHYNLAAYVTDEATRVVRVGSTEDAALQSAQPGVIKQVYAELVKYEIEYDREPYNVSPRHQSIRSPAEIIEERRGTCLDLALLFAGLCLSNRLLPCVIIFEDHAIVGISLSNWIADWNSATRPCRSSFSKPVTDPSVLRELVENGDYLMVECTGVAKSFSWQAAPIATAPETMGREDGVMSFERAAVAGRMQIFGPRRMELAVDIATAHLSWQKKSYPLEANIVGRLTARQLTGLKVELVKEGVSDELAREVFLKTMSHEPVPDDKSGRPLLFQIMDLFAKKSEQLQKDFVQRVKGGPRFHKSIAEEKRAFMLVKIQPAIEDSTKYLVDAWLFKDEASIPPIHLDPPMPISDSKYALSDLPRILEALAERSHAYLHTELLQIELLLPFDLLNYPVEDWEIRVGKTTHRPIGKRYPVVVRSWDRIYDKDFRGTWRDWHEHWEKGLPPPKRVSAADVCGLNPDDYGNDLFARLEACGLVFAGISLLAANDRATADQTLWKVLDAGVPIALWYRTPPANSEAVALGMRSLLFDDALDNLPVRLHAARREYKDAFGATFHPAFTEHLALLWDDPSRMPPDLTSSMQSIR